VPVSVADGDDPRAAPSAIHGHLVADGQPFVLTIAMVITVRDGQIVHSRDYSDPVAGARVLGRLPELVKALAQR